MGLLPIRLNRNKGKWSSMKTYTLGAMADSYYEYLLKMWLLKQQKVTVFCAFLQGHGLKSSVKITFNLKSN